MSEKLKAWVVLGWSCEEHESAKYWCAAFFLDKISAEKARGVLEKEGHAYLAFVEKVRDAGVEVPPWRLDDPEYFQSFAKEREEILRTMIDRRFQPNSIFGYYVEEVFEGF